MENISLIYILGTSFSGSSILGYILGSAENVHDLGELKLFYRAHQETPGRCSCGELITKCPFWSPLYKKGYDIFELPTLWEKLRDVAGVIICRPFPQNKLPQTPDLELLKEIKKQINPPKNSTCLIDTSKSLWRLVHLLNCRGIEVKVIYLRRNIFGNDFPKSFLYNLCR